MKKLPLFLLLISLSFKSFSQEYSSSTSAEFTLGNGLVFESGDNYFFKLSGMIQPNFSIQSAQIEFQSNDNVDYFFNSKHTFFSFSGFSKKEKVSFLMLADFSNSSPLLDAWASYHVSNNINFSFGQKLINGNNREMAFTEGNLQFGERSVLSQNFSNSGREFGLFMDLNFSSNNFNINPSFGITSGDGRSSFGTDSRDMDYGGFKYFGRVDIYPLGYFSDGNNLQVADIKKEISPKFVFGISASYNDGVSNSVGEGHGDFMLYNINGDLQLPDYMQVYCDFLFKFKGFSFLAEYANASALSLQQIYTDPLAISLLQPSQISEFLALGSAINFNLGYVLNNGIGIDLSFSEVTPEYDLNSNSIINPITAASFGVSKYFLENDFKITTSISDQKDINNTSLIFANIMLQLRL